MKALCTVWNRLRAMDPSSGLMVVVILASAVVLGAGAASDVDQYFPNNLGVVEPGTVYRSGQLDRLLIRQVLEDLEIKRIVVMHSYNPRDPDHVAELEAARELGIDVQWFAMGGNGVGPTDAITTDHYASVVALLAEAQRTHTPTLVHCGAGAQRTGGTVAAYRLLVRGDDPAEVYADATRYDWDPEEDLAWPTFLNRNMRALAEELVKRGVIAQVPDPLPHFAR